MRIDLLTLFPKMVEGVLGESILKRAQNKKKVGVLVHNLRDWTTDSHHTADDKPFGGGPGMVMKVEPILRAFESLGVVNGKRSGGVGKAKSSNRFLPDPVSYRKVSAPDRRVILLTPQGAKFSQDNAKRLARFKHLVFLCGHYEGVDERVSSFIDEEVSIGDYVLTCGEIPALAVIDAVVRLLPGVLGDAASLASESFEEGLLEYPHYTRPAEFAGLRVPDILMGGDHGKIEKWRKDEAVRRTMMRRPELIKHSNRRV